MANPAYSTPDTEVVSHDKTALPPRFNVIMHNDDYTTMEFVIEALESIFRKQPTDATRIMLTIHHKGQAICGTYPYEIAETKVEQTHLRAKNAGHPLRCSIEKA
ncbi:MAG: ATP-dependent Clp protease adaptor ClpS [Desulfuromonas sp.]|nr:ATP-dependent Clp protease adaptor ClpS [Desulfuromonas sp.]